jgi:Gluconate 2-dehydrogenase subunit 3
MERRELLKMIALITGGMVAGGDVFLSGCSSSAGSKTFFSKETIDLLDEVGETILPRTATPGAKDANIGKFMETIVADCYYPAEQKLFMEGIGQLKKLCTQKFGKEFITCTAQQRTELIKQIDEEAKQYNAKIQPAYHQANDQAKGTLAYKKDELPCHWFTLIKQLTLWGFFTSEVGATKALRYDAVPGRYDGEVAYKKGDRALYPCY